MYNCPLLFYTVGRWTVRPKPVTRHSDLSHDKISQGNQRSSSNRSLCVKWIAPRSISFIKYFHNIDIILIDSYNTFIYLSFFMKEGVSNYDKQHD